MSESLNVIVRTTDALWAAIKSAKAGDTIELAPGNYSALRLNGINIAGEVKITSADPGHPAVIAGLTITSSSGLTFSNLEVTVNPLNGFAVLLGSTKNMIFDQLNLHGASVGDGNAVMVRNSTNVTVSNSDIHHLGTGLNHLDSNQVVFSGNKLHDLQADGIRGGGSSNVTITGNHFTNFYPKAGDHPDAIQFWTQAVKTASQNITITDNVFVRGDGQPIQGIFVGNEAQLTYLNVTITGNAIIGGMYHGIALTNGANVRVENNLVQGYTDMTSWILLSKTTGSTLAGNQATDFKYDSTNVGLVLADNIRIAKGVMGDTLTLSKWQGQGEPIGPPPVLVSPDVWDDWGGGYFAPGLVAAVPSAPAVAPVVAARFDFGGEVHEFSPFLAGNAGGWFL